MESKETKSIEPTITVITKYILYYRFVNMIFIYISIFEKYLVIYVVKAKTVQIRSIIHGARQYSFLL
jgi:hypothetical protein